MMTVIILFILVLSNDIYGLWGKHVTPPLKTYNLPNGARVNCRIRTKENECPYDHEVGHCNSNNTLVECVPCRNGYRNCERVSNIKDLKCYKPELECEPNQILVVTNLTEGGCRTECICNKSAGLVMDDGECVKHPVCGFNSTLQDGMCSGCPSGMYKPWVGYEDCIPVPTPPDTFLTPAQIPPNMNKTSEEQTPAPTLLPTMINVTTVRAVSSTEVFMQWKRPGDMNNYSIILEAQQERKTVNLSNDKETVSTTVTDLRPATLYTAHILASDGVDSITSHMIKVKTKEKEETGDGSMTSTAFWSLIVCVVILIVLIGFVVMYAIRKCKKKHVFLIGPPPYTEQDPGQREPMIRNDNRVNHTTDPLLGKTSSTNGNSLRNNVLRPTDSVIDMSVSRDINDSVTSERSDAGPDTTQVKSSYSGQSDGQLGPEMPAQNFISDVDPGPNIREAGSSDSSSSGQSMQRRSSCSSQTFKKVPMPSAAINLPPYSKHDPHSDFGPLAMKGDNSEV